MKLKGLVWFFTIALIVISVWELSYTWVVRNYENRVRIDAQTTIKKLYPSASAEEKEMLTKERVKRNLDSTKDKRIFPFIGTTYQQCKENELNLGLDLQGGMSLTLEVNLEGLIKSLSNSPREPRLIQALNTATANKTSSESDFITRFSDAFIKANGAGKLSSLFAGSNKQVKIGDDDNTVIEKIRTTAKGAISQTNQIITKRIDKFGVAQPNINLDENKGVINVELAGITDLDRVKKFLQSSANLQFWEVYQNDEIASALGVAQENLSKYLAQTTGDSTGLYDNALFKIIEPQKDDDGKPVNNPFLIGVVKVQDTTKFYSYITNEAFKSALPGDLKFLLGVLEKSKKGNKQYYPVYAIKTIPGSDKAPLEGDCVEDASQDFDERGRPAIKMNMTNTGSKAWARLTAKNIGRPIAIVLDDVVYSAPNVRNAIEGGSSEITGSFTVNEAQDLANILKSGKLDAPAKIVADQVVGPT
ncbi:MAG: protein translocase subunit SecDF, partial [Ferruginibacter sp.]|nr:protein translocase subunit SecDF [Ferruginibacter sp.]